MARRSSEEKDLESLSLALQSVRAGDHAAAKSSLDSIAELDFYSSDPPEATSTQDVKALRIATLRAETADHDSDYNAAALALRPFKALIGDLKRLRESGQQVFALPRGGVSRSILRQQLYYLWQASVVEYRAGDFARSHELLDTALHIANRMDPRSEGLLTQLSYGAGKLFFHEGDLERATIMYRTALVRASERLDNVCREAGIATVADLAKLSERSDSNTGERVATRRRDQEIINEARAAQYHIGKLLALGLGHCLREQGRLEEAHSVIVGGRLLLEMYPDTALIYHARLLQGSVERGAAGENNPKLLNAAMRQLRNCAMVFGQLKGDGVFRTTYELALTLMQQTSLAEAKTLLSELLAASRERDDKKWIANAHLGLSRVARREGAHGDAVKSAKAAMKIAVPDFPRLVLRATVQLALAEYKLITSVTPVSKSRLANVDKDLAKCLGGLDPKDIRNRVELLLLRARILNAMGRRAEGREQLQEYEKIGHFVQIGRVREFADTVKSELYPRLQLDAPVDAPEPIFDLQRNGQAMESYVFARCEDRMPNATAPEKAAALGFKRLATYWAHRKKVVGLRTGGHRPQEGRR